MKDGNNLINFYFKFKALSYQQFMGWRRSREE